MVVGTSEDSALEGFRKRRAVYVWGAGAVSAIIVLFAALLTFQASRQGSTARRLQESEARFRAIFDQAAMGIGERTLEGRWLRVNWELCSILGYTSEELLSMSVLDHTHPADRDATIVHSNKLRAKEADSFTIDKRYLRKDGSTVWVRNATAMISDAQGKDDYVISIIEDISAQKAAEAEAKGLRDALEQRVEQRTAELAAANRGLESFSYSVSHDLRTPLRAISGFAQILARRHRDSLNEEGRHYMDNIVRASAQMGRLIEDLLNYSRLGRKALQLDTVDLTENLGGIIENLQPRIRERGAKIRVQPGLPAVRADRTLLGQVFSNLLENALNYCAPGVAPSIDVTCRTEGAHVVVSVKDNGIGIAAEHFESIFGVFQRLHNQDDYPGTGIGLATVKQAVQMMDGSVSVESTVGAGSIFHVKLVGLTT
jgi:PAS domain S-box-containing protein